MSETPKRKGPGFTGYAGWILAAIFFFYAWILRVSPSVMVDQLMRDFAVSGAILGNLSAVYFYAYASLQLPVGVMLDRWGPRKVMSIAVIGAGVGCLIFSVAPTVEIAYVGRALMGAGAAFGLVGSMVLAGNWFAPHRFAMLSGLAMAFGLTGGIVGQAPVSLLVEGQGWRTTIMILGTGALVLAALFWLIARDRPPGMPVPKPAHEADGDTILASLWRVAKRPQTIVIALSIGLVSSPMLSFAALWGVPYTVSKFAVDRPTAAFATSMMLFGFVLGGPVWGWISDKVGRRKSPILLGYVAGGVAMTIALYVPGVPFVLYYVLLFITGLGSSAMVIVYALTREHNATGGTGAALGLVNMAAVAGGAVFQPVVGLLLDLQWDGTVAGGARVYSQTAFDNAMLTMPALFVLSLLCSVAIRETYCRPYDRAATSTRAAA